MLGYAYCTICVRSNTFQFKPKLAGETVKYYLTANMHCSLKPVKINTDCFNDNFHLKFTSKRLNSRHEKPCNVIVAGVNDCVKCLLNNYVDFHWCLNLRFRD